MKMLNTLMCITLHLHYLMYVTIHIKTTDNYDKQVQEIYVQYTSTCF